MAYDAIVVLAAGIQDDGSLPQSAKDRIYRAKELYDKRVASHILFSGRWSVYRKTHRPPVTEAQAMSLFAQQLAVPKKAILKEEKSHTTKENAYYTHKLFIKPLQWKRIILVTSAAHMQRARHCFEAAVGKDCEITCEAASSSGGLWYVMRSRIKEILRFVATLNIG